VATSWDGIPTYIGAGPGGQQATLITADDEACDELSRIWDDLQAAQFVPRIFRNGEAWHTPQTLATIERLGLLYDSTALPGVATAGHIRNWRETINQPFFPDPVDVRRPGPPRATLEIPMNTWNVKAPYEAQPRLRYMNPAVHADIFDRALQSWNGTTRAAALSVWVLICHPDEAWPKRGPDQLYARCLDTLEKNIARLIEHVGSAGQTLEFVTMSEAGQRWKQQYGFST